MAKWTPQQKARFKETMAAKRAAREHAPATDSLQLLALKVLAAILGVR